MQKYAGGFKARLAKHFITTISYIVRISFQLEHINPAQTDMRMIYN
jgi:hypothetical protein